MITRLAILDLARDLRIAFEKRMQVCVQHEGVTVYYNTIEVDWEKVAESILIRERRVA